MPPPRPPRRHSHTRVRSSETMQQPNLALTAIQDSLPPPKHKRSTDEVFNEPQRLHKVLASCGFGSRRAMEDMIIAGRITVNRLPAEVGQKVGPGDEVRINGEMVKVRFSEPRPRILMYHKPTGEIVTRDDPEGRPTVFEKLPNIGNGKWINVGRLDYNTEGLMLFTNSGELANRLMHPRYEVEREYAVRIMGRLSDEQMQALTTGVELEDGPAKCESVADGGGEEEGANHWYHVVLKEGRNREVRRLFEALGLTVSRLIRTRYGTLSMPSVMKRADTLELEPAEVAAVMETAGLKVQGGPPIGQPRPQGGGKGNRGRHQNGRQQGAPTQGGQPGEPGQPRQPGQQGQGGQPAARQGQSRPQGQGPRHQGQQRRHGQQGNQGQPVAHAQPAVTLGEDGIALPPDDDIGNRIGNSARPAGQPGQRPQGKHGGRRGKGGPRPEGFGRQGPPNGQSQGQPQGQNHDQPQGQPRGQNGQAPRQQRQRADFDTQQPMSNANASPFGSHRMGVPGGPRGGQRGGPPGQGGFANRGNRSGPRGRPGGGKGNQQGNSQGGGQGNGQFRGKGGGSGNTAGNGPRRSGQPRGEANGNVAPPAADPNRAPREEANGNIAVRNPVVPRDDDD
ncbi:MAG: pseudouridine synthase [Betaproteobacteria bacterium]